MLCPCNSSDKRFQSTPPARGATVIYGRSAYQPWHFNPRPPRGGRHSDAERVDATLDISIHAPREGGDTALLVAAAMCAAISIHAPREGGDRQGPRAPGRGDEFQSTPPARGATWDSPGTKSSPPYFNPRPPRGGRHGAGPVVYAVDRISIHAPREGGDHSQQ